MKKVSIALLVFFVFTSTSFASKSNEEIKKAVLRIECVSINNNLVLPWQVEISEGSGTGFVVNDYNGNKIIITNAHVVSGAKDLVVKKYGCKSSINANIIAVSNELDLALLQVEDQEKFYKDIIPLEFSDLPDTQEEVTVYGYPVGDSSLCVTKGVMSRIINVLYEFSGYSHIAGQVDAAINPGNSGGPVVLKEKVIGIAMQITTGKNISGYGYMIPYLLINQFLSDYKDGFIDGLPSIGPSDIQSIVNDSEKEYYQMDLSMTGCRINRIIPNTIFVNKLLEDDIILSIDGKKIYDDCTIEIRDNEFVPFETIAKSKQIGESNKYKVFRKGSIKEIEIENNIPHSTNLLIKPIYDSKPKYYVYSGLIFTPLTIDYLRNFKSSWGFDYPSYFNNFLNKTSEDPTEEIIIMTLMMKNRAVIGHQMNNKILYSINSTVIKRIEDVKLTIESSKEKFLVFMFKNGPESINKLIIDRELANSLNNQILNDYQIESSMYF